ncbi:MAG: divergent PAP2 family protein [Candidatus Moranbacteria bacterium]|nr:divergent PAP2 family protein [Candidatus Moranbacteria bacterium]
MLYDQSYNIFIIPVLVLILTRVIKFFVFYFRHNRDFGYTLRHAMSYGHMPSVHTALMISIVTSIGNYEGVNSGSFAVAVVLAILIIDDATRLRVYLGDVGRYINMLSSKVGNLDEKEYPRLKERMGHRLNEVVAGGIIGFSLTTILIRILG